MNNDNNDSEFLNACSFGKENAVGSSPTPRTNT
jgi:hypothetical protein